LGERTAVPKYFFEDFAVGQVNDYGPRVVTREEIVAFAAEFDPQPMHLDEEAARHTMLGGLGASGWHSCSLLMRIICDGFVLDSASMGAGGIDEVKWLKPVRPGDSLTVRASVLETRVSQSKPDRGFVKFRYEVINGHGECVMTMQTAMMIRLRNPQAAPAAREKAAGA
jgi:acyl dehydratase